MSSDIYATPDLSKKVRYNRQVQEDTVEWEERQVDIYENTDAIGNNHTDIQSHEGGPHTEKHPPAVQRRPLRVAAYCLGVLCLLMMTGIILSSILFTLERHKLQSRYDQLSNNYSQLQKQISRKWCPDGWSRFGCSCYFKSNEKKTWGQSRADCRQRGADLVIINNKEEQKFVTELNVRGESWIGLQRTWTDTGWKYEWQWVDGSPLSQTFWAPGLPTYDGYQHAATCCSDQGQWTQSGLYESKNWICEK
ncbi:CD209 antigen-like protein E isoform X15 [Epinephelus fuscoguttatus]|uniref:CD209 antigen-like protein E isoform X15 n=1 Tax=Epinephelus fuscoguttatus TaxID=293821 RepID=UPI0020D07B19|nr:CD209 antigen-like protein E isoform X15 [Epinephelus fuscoguttatus]